MPLRFGTLAGTRPPLGSVRGVDRGAAGTTRAPALRDIVALTLVIFVSVVPHVTNLGFYSDDWAFLARLASSPDQSVAGLFAQMNELRNLAPRPVQSGEQAVLWWLFGDDPLGYHVTNSLTLLAAALLFYLALTELGAPKLVAVGSPVLFCLSPAYTSARFWFAAFGYVITVAATCLHLYAELRVVRTRRPAWAWKVVALAAVLVAGLAYEVTLPLLAANSVVAAWHTRRIHGVGLVGTYGRARAALLLLPNAVLLTAIVVFKASAFHDAGMPGGPVYHLGRLVVTAIVVQFGSYGVALPHSFWWALHHVDVAVIALAAVLGVLVYLYARTSFAKGISRRQWLRIATAGIFACGLGYLIFVATGRFGLTSTGVGNRVGTAASLGAALTFVALCGLVCSYFRSHVARRETTSCLLAAVAVAFFVTSEAQATMWSEAYDKERSVLAAIRARVPAPPERAVIIVDGVCPYNGPAVVFESNWDLEGAVRLMYEDASLEADVVTPRFRVTAEGVETRIYERAPAVYPYSDRLIVVDVPGGTATVAEDEATMHALLARSSFDPGTSCPTGSPNSGVVQLPLDDLFARFRG